MYLFLWVVHSASSSIIGKFLIDCFDMLVILSAILLPIKSPVASAVLWIARCDAVFIAFVVDFLAVSIIFCPYLLLKF